MVLLYKDPNGDSIGSSFPSSTKNISNESSANEGEKTTLLEKQLREKENRIIELTLEVKTLKVWNINFMMKRIITVNCWTSN